MGMFSWPAERVGQHWHSETLACRRNCQMLIQELNSKSNVITLI